MFGNFGFDRRMIIIIIAIFAGYNILMRDGGIESVIFAIPALLIAITFHEFAHAYSAYKLGDNTPKHQGRITLNPIKHLDPIGTVLILAAGFGWGRPVEINPSNFDKKWSMSKGEAIVSVAGPLANFILAFLFIIAWYLMRHFGVFADLGDWGNPVRRIVEACILINIGLGIFNLIPLPPLDGSKILMHFLSYNAKAWFVSRQHIFYIIFIIMFVTGMAGNIIMPAIAGVFNGMYWIVSNIAGIFI